MKENEEKDSFELHQVSMKEASLDNLPLGQKLARGWVGPVSRSRGWVWTLGKMIFPSALRG